jgi:hypothetical protein
MRARPMVAFRSRKRVERLVHRLGAAASATAAGSSCPAVACATASRLSSTVLPPSSALPRACILSRAAATRPDTSPAGDLGLALHLLGHGHHAGGQKRAVGRARRFGERLRAGQQRHAQIVGQVVGLLDDRPHAARHGHAQIAVAQRPVDGVEHVEIALHRGGKPVDPGICNAARSMLIRPSRRRSRRARSAALPAHRRACTG